MADLVSSLETAIRSTVGIAPRLRDHVKRIDCYMADAARTGKGEHILHSALPPDSSSNTSLNHIQGHGQDTAVRPASPN